MMRISYSGYCFPLEIMQQAIWLYLRFTFDGRQFVSLYIAASYVLCCV